MKILGGEDLAARGVSDMTLLRPVLNSNTPRAEQMAANATLRKDEWERIDTRVNEVLRERLTIADDLRAAGLTQNVSLGTILRVTERMSDMDAAGVSYDGDVAPLTDRINFEKDTIPVPVISKDFKVDWRQLDSSRTRGEPLDTMHAEVAARKVRDKIQDLVVNGYGAGPSGSSIPGLVNATNRQTYTITTDWDDASPAIIDDVRKMLEKAYNVNLFGPFNLYVPKNYWAVLQQDYSTAKGEKTYFERILAFNDIKAVRPLDSLPADNVVLLQMTRDVIDLTVAQDVTTVQWEKNPFVTLFRVLFVGGPQIKNIETSAGTLTAGLVHAT